MEFPTQFYLANSKLCHINKPEEFYLIDKGHFVIGHAPNLPVAKFQQGDDCELYVLGWLFYKGEQLTSRHSVPNFDKEHIVESPLLTESYGRYVLLLFEQDEVYVLTDVAASLSVFYHAQLQFLASSIDLIKAVNFPVSASQTLHTAVSDCTDACGYWYPGGFCEFPEVRLLFPNHILNLGNGVPRRFWPVEGSLSGTSSSSTEQEGVARCTYLVNEALKCFSTLGSIALPITSGRDSRIILSSICRNGLQQQTTCFTNGSPDSVDVISGAVLANSCGISWCNHDPQSQSVLLPGFGGEICKGYWYLGLDCRISNRTDRIFNAIPFTKYLRSKVLKDGVKNWINDLTQICSDDYMVLDIAYLELRWAATMGQVHYRYDRKYEYSFSIFASRGFIKESLFLPLEIRKRMSLWRHICKKNAPHLIHLPAGIPHYSMHQLPKVLWLMLIGNLLRFEYREIVCSQAAKLGILASFKILLRRVGIEFNKAAS